VEVGGLGEIAAAGFSFVLIATEKYEAGRVFDSESAWRPTGCEPPARAPWGSDPLSGGGGRCTDYFIRTISFCKWVPLWFYIYILVLQTQNQLFASHPRKKQVGMVGWGREGVC
jgi:hypothetical protein